MSKLSKVGIIGAGNVGATITYALVLLRVCVSIVIFDRTFDKAAGQAWDIEDAIPLLSAIEVTPTDRYEDLVDCDVIVITVSAPSKPGESRLVQLGENAGIIRSTVQELDRVAPQAIVILVSNPVDVLTRIAIETSSRSSHLIFGSGTALDTARLSYQLGQHLQVNPSAVNAYVIGEHGDSEFVLWSSASIGAIPLSAFPTEEIVLEQLKQQLTDETRQRGYEIGERKGNTSYGVGTVVVQIIDAVLRDQKQLFTVSVNAHRDYNIGDEVVLGLPCLIGQQGIEQKLVIPRNADEQQALVASANQLKQAYDSLKE